MLSLCVVDDSGILYAYVSRLKKQLADLWPDRNAVEQIAAAQVRLFRKYDARVSPTGKHHVVKLVSLARKEDAFVADLLRLAALIEETAATQSQPRG